MQSIKALHAPPEKSLPVLGSYIGGYNLFLKTLEAMTFGLPVVTSNVASLPEVTGDAVLLVDPQNAIALAETICRILSDTQLRQTLKEKGKARSQQFSWETTAKKQLVLIKVCSQANSFLVSFYPKLLILSINL